MHFVTKLRPTFWNLHKITNFFMPIKSYFEEKISDLIKQFGGGELHKTRWALWFLKISKNTFSILVLEFQPESIKKWQFLKFQKNWKSLHPNEQHRICRLSLVYILTHPNVLCTVYAVLYYIYKYIVNNLVHSIRMYWWETQQKF